MTLPSPIPLSFLLLVGGVVFGLAGLVWLLPYSIPTPDAWTTVLLLLTVTLGVTGVVGLAVQPGPEYTYVANTTDDFADDCSNAPYAYEYDELSPQEQEVFDSALEDSPYTTGSHRGFVVETDAGQENCIEKGSESYRLTVHKYEPDNTRDVVLYFAMALAAAVLCLFLLYDYFERE